MGSIQGAGEPLDVAWQRLAECWEETRMQWHDAVRRQFEEEFWAPLSRQVPATQRELARLAQVIVQAQQRVK